MRLDRPSQTVSTMMSIRYPSDCRDLPKIEAEMKKIIKEALPLERFTLPRNEAIEFMKEKEEPYKVELNRRSAGGCMRSAFYRRVILLTYVQDLTL